ncbi:MAG: hypothetical protein CME64_09135 [Halobacteriovoraceae bacterium]|nr:hypothetical protein [Halobacteriovoraceae bacterium]
MNKFKIVLIVMFFGNICYGLGNGHPHVDHEESHKGHAHADEDKSHKGHAHEDEEKSHKGNAHEDEEKSHKGHAHEDEEKSHKGNAHEDEEKSHKGHGEHKGDDHAGHDDHEGHGSSKAIGKGKAIEEVDERKGFKMSKEAKETIGVKLRKFSYSPLNIPKDALVVSLEEKGIYRYRDGYFKMVKVKIEKESNKTFTVSVNALRDGDQIAIGGVGLLRVTDIYSTDTSEYGHSH